MADIRSRRSWGLRVSLILPLLVLVGVALAWTKHQQQKAVDASKNYVLQYTKLDGWKVATHGPETLFRWIQPSTSLVIRGAVNQVISSENPTPDLDTEGIADYYVDRTKDNMPTWAATKLGKHDGDGMEFEVVRRTTKDRTVVTAYSVKGNTTVLITLFGMGKAKNQVDPHVDELFTFLKTVSLHEKDLSNL